MEKTKGLENLNFYHVNCNSIKNEKSANQYNIILMTINLKNGL